MQSPRPERHTPQAIHAATTVCRPTSGCGSATQGGPGTLARICRGPHLTRAPQDDEKKSTAHQTDDVLHRLHRLTGELACARRAVGEDRIDGDGIALQALDLGADRPDF